jgi:glycosyltransferase involved in cell wall biosynthesis
MRVCHVMAPGPLAGAEHVVLDGSVALSRHGAEVTLCVFSDQRRPEHAATFATEARARGLDTAVFPVRGRLDAWLLRRLHGYYRSSAFDVVHTHGYKAAVYTLLARGGRAALVATHHGETGQSVAVDAYVRLMLMAYRFMDLVFAVSRQVRDSLVARGLRADRVMTLANFVPSLESPGSDGAGPRTVPRDAGTGAGAPPNDSEPQPLELLFLGRLSPEKGLDVLLEALACASRSAGRPVHLTVLGEGPQRPALERRTLALSLGEAVTFAGFHRDVRPFLERADALVLPSLREGLPRAVLEALSVGCPIVASAVGGIPELVSDGVNGLLVPAGDAAALQAALLRLPRELEVLKTRARAAAPALREELGADRWAGRLVAAYGRALRQR